MVRETLIAISIGCQSPELIVVPTDSPGDAVRVVMDYLDNQITFQF